MTRGLTILISLLSSLPAFATIYEVGPGKPYATIGAVPWATLAPGDTVLIYWQAAPYKEKWVICRQGTAIAPITVSGVAGPGGLLPVIDGDAAIVAPGLNYWNEDRGVIKIGGANTPADLMPQYIVIENLDIQRARPPYQFTGDDAALHPYLANASAIYVEKGQFITIRNCTMHDCGNGFFTASQSSDVTVEKCYIFDNGNTGSIFEHNNYTESNGITFQYNRFGPLRAGCSGNNLKDRSAGTVIRCNWIEGGNRQLDLVDSSTLFTDPKYATTWVYGNILLEPTNDGNSQIVHYGGDSGTTAEYRKGTLHFYNNTVVSKRTGNTTLFRLSTNSESADCRNNILYVTASAGSLALIDDTGIVDLRNCWVKAGFVNSHTGGYTGTVNNLGGHVNGTAPGFTDEAGLDYTLATGSGCIGAATTLAGGATLADQYLVHQQSQPRTTAIDIGAFQFGAIGGGGGGGGGSSSGGGKKKRCGLTGLELLLLLLLRRGLLRSA